MWFFKRQCGTKTTVLFCIMSLRCETFREAKYNRHLDLGNGSNKFRDHYFKSWDCILRTSLNETQYKDINVAIELCKTLTRRKRRTLRLCKRVSDARHTTIDCCINSNRHRFWLKYVCGLFCRKLQHSCVFTEQLTADLLVHVSPPNGSYCGLVIYWSANYLNAVSDSLWFVETRYCLPFVPKRNSVCVWRQSA